MLDIPEKLEGYIYHPYGWLNCQLMFHDNPDFVTEDMAKLDQPIYKIKATIIPMEIIDSYSLSVNISINQGKSIEGFISLGDLTNKVISIQHQNGSRLCEFSTEFEYLIPLMIANTKTIISNMYSRIDYLKKCCDVLESSGEVICPTIKYMT